MAKLAFILSLASGLVVMRQELPPVTTIATSIAINLALAPLIAVIAARRGRSVSTWAAAGLGLGMWALAAVLLIGRPPDDSGPRDQPTRPTTPEAA